MLFVTLRDEQSVLFFEIQSRHYYNMIVGTRKTPNVHITVQHSACNNFKIKNVNRFIFLTYRNLFTVKNVCKPVKV